MRKVKWTGHMGEDHTGHLIKIMPLGFVDGVIDAIAVVEMPNGDIEKVVANRCQFTTPYRPEAQSVGNTFPSWQPTQAEVDASRAQEGLESMRHRLTDARYAMVDGNLDGEPMHPAGIEAWLDHIAGTTLQTDVVMHIPPAVGAGPGASPTPTEPCTLVDIAVVELRDCAQNSRMPCSDCPDRGGCVPTGAKVTL